MRDFKYHQEKKMLQWISSLGKDKLAAIQYYADNIAFKKIDIMEGFIVKAIENEKEIMEFLTIGKYKDAKEAKEALKFKFNLTNKIADTLYKKWNETKDKNIALDDESTIVKKEVKKETNEKVNQTENKETEDNGYVFDFKMNGKSYKIENNLITSPQYKSKKYTKEELVNELEENKKLVEECMNEYVKKMKKRIEELTKEKENIEYMFNAWESVINNVE